MKIKRIIIIVFFLGFYSSKISAQSKAECEKIVVATVDAINNKTPEQLEKYLAPDFTFSGQKAPIASMVLNQLLKQLGDVLEYKKISEAEDDGALTLVYEFTYAEKFGTRTSTFVFNGNNRLTSMDLFEIQVKTLSNNNHKIEKTNQEIITIPVQIQDRMPVVRATVNGESRMFILDNGSARLILNSKYLKNGNTNTESISSVQGVNTSISGSDIVQMNDFDFYGIKIGQSDVLTMPLAQLEKEFRPEVYGLIGYEVYKDYDILFDYANQTLTLIQPEATGKYLETHYKRSKIEILPIEMRAHIPTVKVKAGKTEFTFGVDCGAGANLLDEKYYTPLKKNISKMEYTDLSGAGETKSNIKAGKLKEITIGKKKFKNTYTVFNDMSHLNATATCPVHGSQYDGVVQLDGLVGYEILSGQKVLLSFQNKQLLFID